MTVMVGQASCDERRRYVGGQAGNQRGTELNARVPYLYGWHSLIRFVDAGMAMRCGPYIIAGEYKVVASRLLVRSTPSRKFEPVADYVCGYRIYGVGPTWFRPRGTRGRTAPRAAGTFGSWRWGRAPGGSGIW